MILTLILLLVNMHAILTDSHSVFLCDGDCCSRVACNRKSRVHFTPGADGVLVKKKKKKAIESDEIPASKPQQP